MDILFQQLIDSPESSPPASVPPSPAAKREWSSYQLEIFSSLKSGDCHQLVQAVAGSGKTTTLVQALNHVPGTSLFMAFNKAIAEDIRQKAPQSADVKTLNALGHSQWRRNQPAAQLNFKKSLDHLKAVMGETDEFHEWGYQLSRLIGLAKNCAFGIADAEQVGWQEALDFQSVENFVELMDAYQLDFPLELQAELATYALAAFRTSAFDLNCLDFDDQLWMPAFRQWDYPIYQNIFIDEAQDLSTIQHVMLKRLAAKGGRIVAVGDRHQAIYAFRGALCDSMDLLKEKFHMKELPLSICYRCDNDIILEAQQYCPTIEARPGAGPGRVDRSNPPDPGLFSDQLVLCRNNAPLFRAILRHYRAKSPCRVLSNFLESFQSFVRGFKTTYTSDLLAKLDSWISREAEAAQRKGQLGKLDHLWDKYETVKLLAAEFKKTNDLISAVKALGSGTSGPTFATIHKSKGLEAEKVYILRPDLSPAAYATSPEAKQQEANLCYVAVTRAKKELTFGERPKK